MATTPNDLTRQQLDDLDALLQRMLSVPISPKDNPAAPSPTATVAPPAASVPPGVTVRFDSATPTARQPHIAPVMMPTAEVVSKPSPMIFESRIDSRSYFRPDAPPTPSPAPRLFGSTDAMPPVIEQRAATVSVEQDSPFDPEPNITVEPPAFMFQQAMEMPTPDVQDSTIPLMVAAELPLAPLPEPPLFAPANQVPIMAWPIYGVNRLIEGTLTLFGPPGELLTTGPVKWLLGLTGLGLLGFAGAWTARGMGWVNW